MQLQPKYGYVYFIYEYPLDIINSFKDNDVDSKDIKQQITENHIQFVEIFKIGESNNPEQRLKTLQTGNMRKLKIYKLIRFNSKTLAQAFESNLHRIYKSTRILGEWFKISKNDIDNICANFNNAEPPLLVPITQHIPIDETDDTEMSEMSEMSEISEIPEIYEIVNFSQLYKI